jgi:hypothetical protein
MPFPITPVLDNANRADAAEGANWTADPDGAGYAIWNIATNRFAPSTAFSASWWNPTSFAADQEVFVTVPVVPPSGACRLYARISSPGVTASVDDYELEIDGSSSYISKTINGTRTFLSNLGVLFAAGDQMGLRCQGDQIIAFRNGTEIGRVTDSSITGGGFIGKVAQNSTGVRLDDFGGGSLGLPAVSSAGVGATSATGLKKRLPARTSAGTAATSVSAFGAAAAPAIGYFKVYRDSQFSQAVTEFTWDTPLSLGRLPRPRGSVRSVAMGVPSKLYIRNDTATPLKNVRVVLIPLGAQAVRPFADVSPNPDLIPWKSAYNRFVVISTPYMGSGASMAFWLRARLDAQLQPNQRARCAILVMGDT